MRFNTMLAALCCLSLALPVMAADTATTNSDQVLPYEPALKQYRKLDQADGKAAPATDDHAGHDMHHDHADHAKHQHAEHHKPMPVQAPQHEHAEHQHMHGE